MIYKLIIFLPLLGFLITGLFGTRMGAKASELVTIAFMLVAAILSWWVFISVGFLTSEPGFVIHVPIMNWVSSGGVQADWGLRIDTLTAVMLVVVNTVSCLVHLYSVGYMHDDPHRPRFFAYLSLFTFAMLSLVTADNLLQMFFGWEGVGLASYLLIGFWYKKPSACAAAIKAFIVNRVGDFGFLLGMAGLFFLSHTINFDPIFAGARELASHGEAGGDHQAVLNFLWFHLDVQQAITVICLLLFMGAMGKSAQFLLHTWLPDAMEGPTPVSALIHAATMVTAGVFLVARMSPLYELSPDALTFITLIGSITAFFAATIGLVQNDIKRVIAYSTCSQLGYMFAALGAGAYGAAVFHLFTHAFFKALLFLAAGSVIHAVSGDQDMRRMGGLRKHIPVTFWAMIIGTLAITGAGIPGTVIGASGFFSKDAIIESAYVSSSSLASFSFWMLVIAAAFTAFYSWRLIFMTFFGKARASADVMHHAHESPWVMLLPLVLLSIGALFAGYFFLPFFYGHDYDAFWKGALFTSQHNEILELHEEVPEWVKLSPFVAMLAGTVVAIYMYLLKPSSAKALAEAFPKLYAFLLNKWYFDELYDFLFVRAAKRLGNFFWKKGDIGVIDRFGPDGIAAGVSGVTKRVVKLQSGYVYHYAFAMLIGVAALVTWMMLGGAQ
ncbi:NADH-quinone oxidoreductase subunit L [Martelella alba]|uniref:NADH-quinone oxidoreductase subunit L n=1 Tax=Martelella alba TaxID=2590451 RepID=A0A506UJL4_9HYPH|nr:NADH-quinone oxidoreductase subunit L [Martelella alba]TPW33521.1 NADH-quinone oxidoreductase subunit L [Martelella alba]